MAKVLVVDDEKYIREYYKEELNDEGHQVAVIASGHQVLSVIDLFRPQVVVLDIRLAKYDGLDLLQDIRSRFYDLPVILCSAYDTYIEDQRSMAAVHYVIKSFDLSELKTMVKRAIDSRAPDQLTGG